MSEQASVVHSEIGEEIDRRSFAHFLHIRDQLLERVGIPQTDAGRHLAEDLKISEGIDSILSRRMERSQKGILSLLSEVIKDSFRGRKAKTRSLENWRTYIESEIGKNKSLIDMV